MRSTLLLCQNLSIQVILLSPGEIHYSFGSLKFRPGKMQANILLFGVGVQLEYDLYFVDTNK